MMTPYMQEKENQAKLRMRQSECREKISYYRQQMIVQGMATLLFFGAGMYYAKKQSVVVPMLAATSLQESCKKFDLNHQKYKNWKRKSQLLDIS